MNSKTAPTGSDPGHLMRPGTFKLQVFDRFGTDSISCLFIFGGFRI